MAIRTRIGLMLPSTNSTAEPDFNMVAPNDVTIHSQRMWTAPEQTPESIDQMNADVESAAKYLATTKVDLVAYACTTGSFYKAGYDQHIIDLVGGITGAPVVAAAPGVVEALNFLGLKRISVATPYGKWQNDSLGAYYQAAGFEVLNVEGEPVAAAGGSQGPCDQPPESALEFASNVCWPEAEALFCACTAWRSLEVVSALEDRLGKPVVTANQALIWSAFRRLGITHPQSGFGSLMESLAKATV